MAKKKVRNSCQSNNQKTKTPTPPLEDLTVQIQNLKKLNFMLLKQITSNRKQIESLQSALQHSKMNSDKEIRFLFEKVVGEKKEKEYEVDVLKGQVHELKNEKVLFNQERNQIKSKAEKRERKVREQIEKLRLEDQKLIEEKSEKDITIQEFLKDQDLALRNFQESTKKIDGFMKEKNEIEILNNTREMRITELECELMQLYESLKDSSNEDVLMHAKVLELEGNLGLSLEKENEMAMMNSALLKAKKEMEKTTALVCHKEGGQEVVPKEKKLEGEIQLYAKELDTIKNASKSKNGIVDDMTQQLVSLKKFMTEAHKGKTLWTVIALATTIFAAAAFAVYAAKGR